MRKFALIVWLLVPVLAGAYHYGPGQKKLTLDNVDRQIQQAEQLAGSGDWDEALAAYEVALEQLPSDQVKVGRRLRLERAKAMMQVKKLPNAHRDLKSLVDEMSDDAAADTKLLAETKATLANSQYYMTWLMRLEGRPESDWQPEVESARQTFRLLAAEAEKSGDAKLAKAHREDLESSIRLARMELTELQGLPLPSQ